MGTQKAKAALRAEMGQIRVRPEERQEASAVVVERIRATSEWAMAATVLLYAPLPDEVDVLPMFEASKQICFPRFNTDRGYAAAEVDSLNSLVTGKFGILEPPANAVEVGPESIDLVIVPGVAFDRSCNRLGRGRGFYDRWLLDLAGAKLGVGFDHQLVDDLPCENHDVPLHGVVVPSCVIRRA